MVLCRDPWFCAAMGAGRVLDVLDRGLTLHLPVFDGGRPPLRSWIRENSGFGATHLKSHDFSYKANLRLNRSGSAAVIPCECVREAE